MVAPTLTEVMDSLTECVCAALEAIERPACGCGLTIGVPALGPAGCCECDSTAVGNVAAFLERVYPADATTFEQVTRFEDCRPGATVADISLVVVRCYPKVDEQLQVPTLEETTPFAYELNTDMSAVWSGLKCCGTRLVFRDSAIQGDPEGGCSGFAIRVSVLVNMNVDVSGAGS